MVRYATEKWGSDRVAQVITFGTIKTKAALKDSARIHYGQPGFAIADRITKALPPPIMAKDIPVWGITNPEHERYKEAAEVRTLIDTDPDVRNIYQTALGLEGLIRNAGVHACAVIMSSEPLTDAIPLWKRAQDGAIITGWDYPSCEAIGLLKMDFLGLRNLTVIGDALTTSRPTAVSIWTWTICRSMTRRLTNCFPVATLSASSSSMVGRCVICCAGCSPPGSTTSSPCWRCTAPDRWA